MIYPSAQCTVDLKLSIPCFQPLLDRREHIRVILLDRKAPDTYLPVQRTEHLLISQGIHIPKHQIRHPSDLHQISQTAVRCNAQVIVQYRHLFFEPLYVAYPRSDYHTLFHIHPNLIPLYWHQTHYKLSRAETQCKKSAKVKSLADSYLKSF